MGCSSAADLLLPVGGGDGWTEGGAEQGRAAEHDEAVTGSFIVVVV